MDHLNYVGGQEMRHHIGKIRTYTHVAEYELTNHVIIKLDKVIVILIKYKIKN